MPNPDAILLKKFFDGWFIREWFNDNGELHTVPQISVTEYKRYFTLYMKEILDYNSYHHGSVEGRSRMDDFIREHKDRWQLVYVALCDRDSTDGQVNALNDILDDMFAVPGYFVTL